MAGIAAGIYNTLIRRNTVYLTTIFGGAFAFSMFYNDTMDSIWDKINQGRQWKDIKHRYLQGAEDDE